MGFDCAWTYATCDVQTMISALFQRPDVVELSAAKADQEEVWSRLDEESLGFCATDGGTLCIDPGFSLAGEESLLADLSRRVGRVLSMFLATHGGCAGFEVYENGRRVRQVNYQDGKTEVSGSPVPEETKAKLGALRTFYWSECDRLWAAFGLGTEAGNWSGHVSAVASGALRKVRAAKKDAAKKDAAKKDAAKKDAAKKDAAKKTATKKTATKKTATKKTATKKRVAKKTVAKKKATKKKATKKPAAKKAAGR